MYEKTYRKTKKWKKKIHKSNKIGWDFFLYLNSFFYSFAFLSVLLHMCMSVRVFVPYIRLIFFYLFDENVHFDHMRWLYVLCLHFVCYKFGCIWHFLVNSFFYYFGSFVYMVEIYQRLSGLSNKIKIIFFFFMLI